MNVLRRPAAADFAVSAAFGALSFILLFVNYWIPPDKIFDEVYFARAAEEYLTRQYIYENTHPPVTKLLITLSTMLFGGMHGGDNAWGWRFLDVVFGALAVALLYLLARQMSGSRVFGAYAAGLFMFDGMHFVQSRIATPESFVVCFSLATLYGLYGFWNARLQEPALPPPTLERRLAGAGIATVLSAAIVALRFPHEILAAQIIAGLYALAGFYAVYRIWAEPRILHERSLRWLLVWAVSIALLVSSKWYGVMAFGVALAVFVWDRRKFRLDFVAAVVVFVTCTVYFAAYTPQFVGLRDLPQSAPRAYTLSDVVTMQYNAYEYHKNLRATHPYASQWWQWPLDLRPILYYANYGAAGKTSTAAMIYTLPNPLILWLGLLTVPLVGYWGVRERNRTFVLVVLTYAAQWLPWIGSPRIAFAYHFYVNIPLICICTAFTAQRLAARASESPRVQNWVRVGIAVYFASVAAAFAYFYPILAAVAIPTQAWLQRMWLKSWM
ncbi:MAG TPA: phospholipid carrier-dependent glycosyltransferase [Candidatus Baltobacteraceae bacterium]|jgi:dolichyl-phosphate-mannose--protein O-mannosyl transferase|nr:phospholipid carrier-dependent glycosyltransferase [Candidatus Baltobacteraceae bacterium]